ncbi:MAG TPA: DUF6089 family protein [Bacteroidia bacterium]|nr:DUF6089 family protein [Bacteroidia bacterium]
MNSRTRLNFLVFIAAFLPGTFAFGQSSEMGLFLGIGTYKGEISPHLFNTKTIKPAVGILYRRNLNSHWAYRLGLTYGAVAGDDAKSNDEYQLRRNLSFRARILDLHGAFEFNFLPYQLANESSAPATPFVFGGLSLYHFNPQAELNGDWYDLQPLGTEGQGTSAYPSREKYKRTQMALMFGGGFKFKFSKMFGITLEAGARRLYTDYLDDISKTYADKGVLQAAYGDVSVQLSDRSTDGQAADNTDRQRGNASDKDWYMFTGITLNFTLSSKYSSNCTPFRQKLR